MPRQRREGRTRKISSRTLFSGENYYLKKSFASVMIEILKSVLKAYHLTAISILCHDRPVLPFHEVSHRLDSNRQPHVIQRYGVPSPLDNQYRLHDQAVYSMWMHFVTFCSIDPANPNNHQETDVEMSAFTHPRFEYPLKSPNLSSIFSSSSKSNLSCDRQNRPRCIFLEETLDVNPFINASRLDVFKTLSSGEALQSCYTSRGSTRCSSLVSSRCPSVVPSRLSSAAQSNYSSARTTLASSPVQGLSSTSAQQLASSQFFRGHLESRINSFEKAKPSPCLALFDLPFDTKGQLDMERWGHSEMDTSSMPQSGRSVPTEEYRRRMHCSNGVIASDHPYYNEKTATASAFGSRKEVTPIKFKVSTPTNNKSSTSTAATPSFQHYEIEKKISEGIMARRAIAFENMGHCNIEDDMDTSLHSFDFLMNDNEPDAASHFASLSVAKDSNKVLSLADAFSSPPTSTTPLSHSPFNFGISSPTGVSDISNFSATTASACKTADSMDFVSLYRRFDATERRYPSQSNLDTAVSYNVWEDLEPQFKSISVFNSTHLPDRLI